MGRCAQFISENVDCNFVDIHAACPLDQLHKKGCGSILTTKHTELQRMVLSMAPPLNKNGIALTCKIRMAHFENDARHS